jgi:23S rRNA (cytosine1962-C5)-methyltransferase
MVARHLKSELNKGNVFMRNQDLESILQAIAQRKTRFQEPNTNVFRLYNGFTEGPLDLVLEIYGTTLLISEHGKGQRLDSRSYELVWEASRSEFPFLTSAFLKRRNAAGDSEKKGLLLFGENLASSVLENGVKYAIDFQTNQDSSFYLDTRNLRIWLKNQLRGRTLLNTFAYTGSLGVAALASGAEKVTQTDIKPRFLDLARLSCQLNGFSDRKHEIITGDFFRVVSRIKTGKKIYDCVILDPPFFSSTQAGRVDLAENSLRLVNKVRPLVKHEGTLVLVNNSLYLSGQDFYRQVESICQEGYVSIKEIIPVPADVSGYAETVKSGPPLDPSPFNHSTKIIVLDIRRKDGRRD